MGFHDYEASCENYFCNLIGPDEDQTVCPYAPQPELVVNVGLQTGSFLFGKDISMLNAHDYRPNEFVTSDVRHSTCPKPQPRTHDTLMHPAR